jgi:hypothetical protein
MRYILRIAAALALSLALCGCLPTINVQNAVNLNTTQGVVAAYGILANQLDVLKAQPLCKTGTKPSLTDICVPRSLIVRLQSGMTIAKVAVNNAVAFEQANPTIAPTQYISAASSALLSVQNVYNAAATTANATTGS